MLAPFCVFAAVIAHVPTYDGCSSGCCKPPHHHTTSQVVYIRGTGGLEVHIDSSSKPFDILGHEVIDIDAVFKYEYDPSTYSLYVGCGGCMPGVDPIVVAPTTIPGYEPGVLEPFTQTSYRSVWKKEDRTFNTSVLLESGCPEQHFTIRVVDYSNRTDGSPLIWGAIIGLKESFTFVELLSFPIYIAKNHGDSWNLVGWTLYVLLPFSVLEWWAKRWAIKRYIWGGMPSPLDASMRYRPRAWFYDLAIIGFVWSAWEMFVHLLIAQSNAEFGHEFFVTLGGVIGIGIGIPFPITLASFWSMYHPTWVLAQSWWIPLEMLAAFCYLFLFGAGFYLGPAAVFLASVARTVEHFSQLRNTVYVPLMQQATVVNEYPNDKTEVATEATLPYLSLKQ